MVRPVAALDVLRHVTDLAAEACWPGDVRLLT